MKKSLLLIFGVAAMLLAVSCQKERTSAPVQSVSVRTNVSKIVYSASGDTDALTLDATAGWTAVSRAEWLTVTPGSGPRGVCEVTVTIAANDGGRLQNNFSYGRREDAGVHKHEEYCISGRFSSG